MWQRGVNSDVVLKQMGRSAGPPVGGSGPSMVGAGASRGRGGGSMDRGRGRARGVGSAAGYNRGTSYEDGGDPGDHGTRREGPPTGYGRGTTRPFERSQVERLTTTQFYIQIHCVFLFYHILPIFTSLRIVRD